MELPNSQEKNNKGNEMTEAEFLNKTMGGKWHNIFTVAL